MSETFSHRHLVQFYETDQMGIVHHSNYLRFFEEARVAWAHHHGILDYQKPESAARFAVLSSQVDHKKPAVFGDELWTEVKGFLNGGRVRFEYHTWRGERGHFRELIAQGQTVHVAMTLDLKPTRPAKDLIKLLRRD